jgi:hypothetical protein
LADKERYRKLVGKLIYLVHISLIEETGMLSCQSNDTPVEEGLKL